MSIQITTVQDILDQPPVIQFRRAQMKPCPKAGEVRFGRVAELTAPKDLRMRDEIMVRILGVEWVNGVNGPMGVWVAWQPETGWILPHSDFGWDIAHLGEVE